MMLTAAQVATLLGLSESRHFGRNLPHTYGAGVRLRLVVCPLRRRVTHARFKTAAHAPSALQPARPFAIMSALLSDTVPVERCAGLKQALLSQLCMTQ